MSQQERLDGVCAFLGGQTLDDNPYEAGTAEAVDWAEGWRGAREADAEDPNWR